MTIETGDIVKVVLDYLYPGAGTALNIFYYKLFDAPQTDQDVIDALVDWATNQWGDHWQDMAPTNATLNNIALYVVSELGEVLRDLGTTNLNISGTQTGEVSPAAVSAFLQAYTTVPQVRGSKYVPGIAEGRVVNGSFDASALAVLAFLLIDYLDNVLVTAGNNLVPGVLSKKILDFKAFTDSGLIQTLPAYQRRRKDGVGT